MIKKYFLALSLLFITFSVSSQNQVLDSIPEYHAQLKKAIEVADIHTSSEVDDWPAVNPNQAINDLICKILRSPSIIKYSLDSLFNLPLLSVNYSIDKNLYLISWYENTGGSFKSYLTIVAYRKANHQYQVIPAINDNESPSVFCGDGALFFMIEMMPSKEQTIYACFGSVIGCNTCCASIVSVIAAKNDTLNFNYPAFIYNNSEQKNISTTSSCMNIDSRCGDLTIFEYSPKKRRIRYEYLTDDLTPIRIAENEKSKNIKGQFIWTGAYFKETIHKN